MKIEIGNTKPENFFDRWPGEFNIFSHFVLLLTLRSFTPTAGHAVAGLLPQDVLADILPPAGTPPAENWANYSVVPIPLNGGVTCL